MKVYHGTSKHNWELKYPDNTTLYLTSNFDEATIRAQEVAADDEYSRIRPLPIVVSVNIDKLLEKDLEFDIDTNWVRSLADGGSSKVSDLKFLSWEDTLRQCGSFTIVGDIENLKPLFEIEKIGFKKS